MNDAKNKNFKFDIKPLNVRAKWNNMLARQRNEEEYWREKSIERDVNDAKHYGIDRRGEL